MNSIIVITPVAKVEALQLVQDRVDLVTRIMWASQR